MAKGTRVVALAVRTYELSLSSYSVLELQNCYFVPVLSKNIVSVSCLRKQGFHLGTKDNCCQLWLNETFYGTSTDNNGIYVLDLDKPIFNINTKRQKVEKDNFKPSYL